MNFAKLAQDAYYTFLTADGYDVRVMAGMAHNQIIMMENHTLKRRQKWQYMLTL